MFPLSVHLHRTRAKVQCLEFQGTAKTTVLFPLNAWGLGVRGSGGGGGGGILQKGTLFTP